MARCWRRRGLGELLARPRREGSPTCSCAAPAPDAPADAAASSSTRSGEHWDARDWRGRSWLSTAPPIRGVLAAAGARLGELDCPALVLWGADDPYIGAADGRAYERRAPERAVRELVEGAGHWPWIDRPELVDRVADFLAG